MYLHNIKDDTMVCDYTLVYDSDCKLILDMYAYGAQFEPYCLDVNAEVNVLDTGLVSLNIYDYGKIKTRRSEILEDNNLLYIYSTKAVEAAKKMIYECNRIEQKKLQCVPKEIITLFESVVHVIGYRELSDIASEKLATELGIATIEKIAVPSYLALTEKNFNVLHCQSKREELELFVKEYGYLYTFDITKNKYEDVDELKVLVANKKSEGKEVPQKLHVDYAYDEAMSKREISFYNFSWYSEVKHIYQLRILRNFREIMKNWDLDICYTDIRSLLAYANSIKRDR